MILPRNLFLVNEHTLAGDVDAGDLLAFLEQWLHAELPEALGRGRGLKVHEVRVTRVDRAETGSTVKVVIRHDRDQNSPARGVQVLAQRTAAAEVVLRGKSFVPYTDLPEHRRFTHTGPVDTEG